jgi:hypothetical protein
MAGTVAARAVAGRDGRFGFELASSRDDGEIRRLLRDHAFPGAISLSLEREPNAAIAASIEGDVHQTILARDQFTGQVAEIATRAVRDAFVNGEPSRVGYLGQLRIDRRYRRHRSLLEDGFAFCRALHNRGDARLYLTSIVADNEAARRLLLTRRWTAGPRFTEIDRLVTLVIPLLRQPRPIDIEGIRIDRGTPPRVGEIAACLWRNLRRYQFAPCWTAEDLLSADRTRGLSPEHFFVAIRQGRVIGCLGCWDQRAFKQVVVRGYSPTLTRWRPLVNATAPWLGAPALPAVGQPLAFAYLSHAAVDDDRDDVMAALAAAACRQARTAGLDDVAIAVTAGHPLLGAIARGFRHRAYFRVLAVANWPDGDARLRSLDGRLPQPEVAVL